jgi:SAM-dependent methyltransferase
VAFAPVVKTGILWTTRRARTLADDQRYRLRDRALARAERAAVSELGYAALEGTASPEGRARVRELQRRRELEREFHERRPWITSFVLNGDTYGGGFQPPEKLREQFANSFPRVHTIIELGSLEGGHTFPLAQMPGIERVVAIEGRAENVERARVVERALGIENVEFVVGNLETMDLAPLGSFDAIFCTGLLYHLPRPWELLERLAAVSERMYVWTQCADQAVDGHGAGGYAGRRYNEWGRWEPLSGLSPKSFWPTREELVRMISDAGFPHVQVLGEDQVPQRGPALMLVAARRLELLAPQR